MNPLKFDFVMALRIEGTLIESGLNLSPFTAQLLLLHAQHSSKMKIETCCSMLGQFFEAQNWTLLPVDHKGWNVKISTFGIAVCEFDVNR